METIVNVEATSQSPAEITCDLLAVGVSSDLAELDALDARYGGALKPLCSHRRFTGAAGATLEVPGFGHLGATMLLLVGIGDGSDRAVRDALGKAGREARAQGARSLAVAFPANAEAVVEGVASGNYVYDKYKPEKDQTTALATLTVVGDAPDKGALIRADAQSWTRDLVNAPPAELYPETLADAARSLADIEGVTCEVWDFERCRAEGCVGIIAVGRGSSKPGCMIRLRYRHPDAKAHIALVGKGVTFDAGGYSLKPSNAMQTMRCDMAGGALMLGVHKAVAELGLPVNVDTFVGAVENLVDGDAFKLSDILRYRNGVTVEIHNTDAEGRLVLADCLIEACKIEGVQHVVDAATLTGACVVAVGGDFTGLFTDDDGLADSLSTASAACSEGLWRLPLHAPYNEMLKGEWSQIKNVGGRAAGATTAALFLQHFVTKGTSWAHLDVAGSAFHDKGNRRYAAGATGEMVRSLTSWIASLG
jgi:leucyl aminopeptidase